MGFKITERTHPNLMTIRIEWENDFNYQIEPGDPSIKQYFTTGWKPEWADDFFPKRSMKQELRESAIAFKEICQSVFKSKILNR